MGRNYLLTGFADEIDQDLKTQIENLQKLNMHYVEMRGVDGNNLIFHSDDKVKEIKARLDATGIALSALGSPLGKIGIEDPFEKHFEEFKRAVEIAHMMETKNIRMFSFYVPEGQGKKYKEQVFDRLGQFVDYAAANEAVLLHENEKGIYGEMAAECRELMDAFYGDHFKAIFDFANFVQAKQDTLEAYELLKDYIAYIHVKDALWENGSVVPAGMGDGNVATILKNLYANGFSGFLSLEPHLFNFSGFAGLEREKDAIVGGETKVLSGVEAF
ncbi:MAG: sugar phosphate isomerase/epimerase, partial [Lachnospiraceae bacterium]|nr:sugar phosphate isomerase/epimerase [Lachnospiraceae bacterium]